MYVHICIHTHIYTYTYNIEYTHTIYTIYMYIVCVYFISTDKDGQRHVGISMHTLIQGWIVIYVRGLIGKELVREIGLCDYGSWEVSSKGTLSVTDPGMPTIVLNKPERLKTRKYHDAISSLIPNAFGTQGAADIGSSVPVAGSLESWCQRLAGTFSPWKTNSKERKRNSFCPLCKTPADWTVFSLLWEDFLHVVLWRNHHIGHTATDALLPLPELLSPANQISRHNTNCSCTMLPYTWASFFIFPALNPHVACIIQLSASSPPPSHCSLLPPTPAPCIFQLQSRVSNTIPTPHVLSFWNPSLTQAPSFLFRLTAIASIPTLLLAVLGKDSFCWSAICTYASDPFHDLRELCLSEWGKAKGADNDEPGSVLWCGREEASLEKLPMLLFILGKGCCDLLRGQLQPRVLLFWSVFFFLRACVCAVVCLCVYVCVCILLEAWVLPWVLFFR